MTITRQRRMMIPLSFRCRFRLRSKMPPHVSVKVYRANQCFPSIYRETERRMAYRTA